MCGKPFARHDTLLRHGKLHLPETSSGCGAGTPVYDQPRNHEPTQQPAWNPENDVTGTSQTDPVDLDNVAEGHQAEQTQVTSIDFESVPTFTETEDYLQYLLSFPTGWPISMSAAVSPETLGDHGLIPNTGVSSQNQERSEEISPQAVLQMNAMITDVVCLDFLIY